jgi:hypothetical protein
MYTVKNPELAGSGLEVKFLYARSENLPFNFHFKNPKILFAHHKVKLIFYFEQDAKSFEQDCSPCRMCHCA